MIWYMINVYLYMMSNMIDDNVWIMFNVDYDMWCMIFLNDMMYDMIIICYFMSSITHIITWSPFKGNPWKSNGWIQASLGNVNDDVKNDHIYDEC